MMTFSLELPEQAYSQFLPFQSNAFEINNFLIPSGPSFSIPIQSEIPNNSSHHQTFLNDEFLIPTPFPLYSPKFTTAAHPNANSTWSTEFLLPWDLGLLPFFYPGNLTQIEASDPEFLEVEKDAIVTAYLDFETKTIDCGKLGKVKVKDLTKGNLKFVVKVRDNTGIYQVTIKPQGEDRKECTFSRDSPTPEATVTLKWAVNLGNIDRYLGGGFNVNFSAEDLNGNKVWGDGHVDGVAEKVCKAIIEAIKAAVEAIVALLDALFEWIWNCIRGMINTITKPIVDAIDNYVNGIIDAINKAFGMLFDLNETNDDEFDPINGALLVFNAVFGPIIKAMLALTVVLISANLIFTAVTGGTVALLEKAVDFIIPLIICIVGTIALSNNGPMLDLLSSANDVIGSGMNEVMNQIGQQTQNFQKATYYTKILTFIGVFGYFVYLMMKGRDAAGASNLCMDMARKGLTTVVIPHGIIMGDPALVTALNSQYKVYIDLAGEAAIILIMTILATIIPLLIEKKTGPSSPIISIIMGIIGLIAAINGFFKVNSGMKNVQEQLGKGDELSDIGFIKLIKKAIYVGFIISSALSIAAALARLCEQQNKSLS